MTKNGGDNVTEYRHVILSGRSSLCGFHAIAEIDFCLFDRNQILSRDSACIYFIDNGFFEL